MDEADDQTEARIRAEMPEESTIDLDVHTRLIAAAVAAARRLSRERAGGGADDRDPDRTS